MSTPDARESGDEDVVALVEALQEDVDAIGSVGGTDDGVDNVDQPEEQHNDISNEWEAIGDEDEDEWKDYYQDLEPYGALAVPVDVPDSDRRSTPEHERTYHTLTSSFERSYNEPADSDQPHAEGDSEEDDYEKLERSIFGTLVEPVTQAVEHLKSTPKKASSGVLDTHEAR